ncbi:D-alanyl-D-alanine carboxypeptidase, partial [Salmonella enterica subsp. enterica serovar Typhi]|nr:D-alanyl-D-alanine carboxypeptidase [Salmonella enterica subsp. enterica serovar Typhi]
VLPYQANAAENDELGLDAGAAILVDANTGEILYEKNTDELLGVASMSKMMTEYIVLESIKNGKISWDQKVKINNYIHRLSGAPGLSNVGLTEGEEYTVKELYQAMAIHSGNAATVALAELIAGTEKNYISVMNQKAEELGLEDF